MSGLDERLPFSAKAHAVLRALRSEQAEIDRLRLAVRQELDRLTGGG